jgi:hypothetical protein
VSKEAFLLLEKIKMKKVKEEKIEKKFVMNEKKDAIL